MIGFSDRTVGKALPTGDSRRGRALRAKLTDLGIFKQDTGHEALRGYVTFPLYDSNDRITGIEGHKFDPKNKNEDIIVIGSGLRADQIYQQRAEQLAGSVKRNTQEDVVDKNASTSTASQSASNYNQPPRASVRLSEHAAQPHASSLTPHDCSEHVIITRGDRQYKVQGLQRNTSALTLKVAIQVSRDELVHLDSVDLVKSASRTAFIKAAALELLVDEQIIRKDIGFILMQLEELRNQQLDAAKSQHQKTVALSDCETLP